MGAMTIRQLNANISRAIAMVEAGETLDILKNGKVVAELRPKSLLDDPARQAAYARALKGLREGVSGLTAPASYDDRTGR